MERIMGHVKRAGQEVGRRIDELVPTIEKVTTDLKPTIDGIKTNFDEWKVPWTNTRASKLDNLDASVSTRSTQASVNALSSNLATSTGKLDTLLGRGTVKRVTRGYIARLHTGWTEERIDTSIYRLSTQITIPAVDVSKSMVLVDVIDPRDASPGTVIAFLTNATTLKVILPGQHQGYQEVDYQVIEFY